MCCLSTSCINTYNVLSGSVCSCWACILEQHMPIPIYQLHYFVIHGRPLFTDNRAAGYALTLLLMFLLLMCIYVQAPPPSSPLPPPVHFYAPHAALPFLLTMLRLLFLLLLLLLQDFTQAQQL